MGLVPREAVAEMVPGTYNIAALQYNTGFDWRKCDLGKVYLPFLLQVWEGP
jgi:hypothetical protein